jgi:PEP-CTERM motif
VKRARLVLIVALFGISCSSAFAQDPKPFTSGCGGVGQPACDADVLTASNPTATFTNLVFLAADENFNTETDQCDEGDVLGLSCNPFNQVAALGVVQNDTGNTITNITVIPSSSEGLSFSCGKTSGTLFTTCMQTGGVFVLSGGSLCTLNADDFKGPDGTYKDDGDHDDTCSGAIIGFVPAPGDPTNLQGDTMSFSATAPEPSSVLLLLFGFVAVGLLGLKKFGNSLA